MTTNPKIIAACQVIESLNGLGTSKDVRLALGITTVAAANLLIQAFMKGLVSTDKRYYPRRYTVTPEWPILRCSGEPAAPESNQDRILASLGAAPATSLQLAERLGIGASTVRAILKSLRESGAIYVSGWHVGKVHQSAIYSPGNGATPEKPILPGADRVLAALPGTIRQICQKAGMGRVRVRAILEELAGQVHISGYAPPVGRNSGGSRAAIYSKDPAEPFKRDTAPPFAYEYAAPLPDAGLPLYRTHWAGLELCRMGVRA